MKTELIPFIGDEGMELPGILWLPEGEPTGLLQITHGMTEHMGRYENFARRLTDAGYAAAGFDLRGHGKNPLFPAEKPKLGAGRYAVMGSRDCVSFDRDGWACTLEDMHRFFQLLAERFPGLPHAMLGFSLGSFLLRDYLHFYDDPVSCAILMGTGAQSAPALAAAKLAAGDQIRKGGFNCTTPIIGQLTFQTYNKAFAPNRTPVDWLCSDPAEQDAYLADPLCRPAISSGLFRQLLESMQRTGSLKTYDRWNKALPVLLISGGDDPVGGRGRGVSRVEAAMKKAGLLHVATELIPGARHDLLHEYRSGAARAAEERILRFLAKP